MRKLDTDKLKEKLKAESKLTDFNIYRFIKKIISNSFFMHRLIAVS